VATVLLIPVLLIVPSKDWDVWGRWTALLATNSPEADPPDHLATSEGRVDLVAVGLAEVAVAEETWG